MTQARDIISRTARRLLGVLLLAVPLAACLQVAGSHGSFDFKDSTPSLPFRSNGFDEISRSENHLVSQMAYTMVQLVTIRVDEAGNHSIVMRNSAPRPNQPPEMVMAARYFALPGSPSVLAVRFNGAALAQRDAVPAGEEDVYFYVFIEKTADIVQILPFSRAAIEAWRPANEADRRLREQALALRVSGQGQNATVLVEDAAQLELALRTASRLPPAQRATLRLRDAASPPRPAPQAAAPHPAQPQASSPTRWRFGRSQDPVTREVTQYANLAPDPTEGGAQPAQMLQARCVGRRLQLVFDNGRLPLRNELSEGRLRAALMEINFDDRMVQRLIWQIIERYPDTAVDPFAVGGLIGLAGMFDPAIQRASTNWNAAWLLNMLAGSDRVVLRVWDARHGAHVLRFSPRAAIADIRRNLSDCVQ